MSEPMIINELPQNFSPRAKPEILHLAAQAVKGRIVHLQAAKPVLYETEELIIRHFFPDDGAALQELALDKEGSAGAIYDGTWPTDEVGSNGFTAYLAEHENYWAVCLKKADRMIGLIAFNNMDEAGNMDLGHMFHTGYRSQGYDTQAIRLMAQFAFEQLGASLIYANNAMDWDGQLQPLNELGLEITQTGPASFVNDVQGQPITFTFCRMEITKEKWMVRNIEA